VGGLRALFGGVSPPKPPVATGLLRWRNAMVKSNGSESKGLTPYTCLCYRWCAFEQSAF